MSNATGLTGLDLKLRRVAAGLQVKHIADAMGISAGRVSRIEREPRVTLEMLTRYTDAIDKYRTSGTSAAA